MAVQHEARRLKLVRIPREFVLSHFQFPALMQGNYRDERVTHFRTVDFRNVPYDVQIVSVGYSQQWAAWELTLEHESFDLVPYGTLVPEIEPCTRAGTIYRRLPPDVHVETADSFVGVQIAEECRDIKESVIDMVDTLNPTRIHKLPSQGGP